MDVIRRLGFFTSLRYLSCRFLQLPLMSLLRRPQRILSLRFRGIQSPVKFRSSGSDLQVIGQIFVHREYQLLDGIKPDEVDTVIDCGANAGYSAVWFLNRFPQCRVIAVEPDPDNFRMLQENLMEYGDRAVTIQAGIWSHDTQLAIESEPYRDGKEWSRQVRELRDGEDGGINAVAIETLAQTHGLEAISVLKVDIEGAECVILREGAENWLPLVDHLVMELHDDTDFGNATPLFAGLFPADRFQITHHDELTYCRPNRPKAM